MITSIRTAAPVAVMAALIGAAAATSLSGAANALPPAPTDHVVVVCDNADAPGVPAALVAWWKQHPGDCKFVSAAAPGDRALVFCEGPAHQWSDALGMIQWFDQNQGSCKTVS